MLTLTVLGLLQAPLAIVDDPVRSSQDILHYDINVDVDSTAEAIWARTSVRYVMRTAGQPLVLDFDRTLTVDSVTIGDARAVPSEEWRWSTDSRGGDVLEVHHAGRTGDTLSAAVFYHGRPANGLRLQPNTHGRPTAFADNWPNRAHHWFPSEDHPSDKATVTFEINVVPSWRVIANGRLVSVDTLANGRARWRWSEGHPIPTYTMVFGAGEMAVSELRHAGGVPNGVWAFPEDSAFAVEVPFRRAAEMVDAYTRLIGPFPYEKLAHVQSSTQFGGMENSSAIFYAARGYVRRTMGEGVVAHEIAHQWFGDAVTAHDWHHLWLSEGFASYFGPLFYQLVGEDSTFRGRMRSARNNYMQSDVVGRPVIDTTEQNYMRLLNANNYPKGAWILHTLRNEIGDSAFFAGVREYYQIFRDSTALSKDLADIMSAQAGRPLEWFFAQWLLQPGYPQLETSWEFDGDRQLLVLEFEQVQDAAWGIYRLKVPIAVHGPDGSVRREVVQVEGIRTGVVIERMASAPARVVVDPDESALLDVRAVWRR